MSRNIRLIDVAEKAGVSRVAAGKVLLGSGNDNIRVSETTAKRIKKWARELGYQPNRSAQRLKGKTGCLLGAVMKANGPEIELMRLVALERLAFQQGHQLLITSLHPERQDNLSESVHTLAAQGAAGIIFITPDLDITKSLADTPILPPYVCCDIPPLIGDEPGVVLDLDYGYQKAIRHLAERGRKRIGVLSIDWGSFPDRYSEYRLIAVREEATRIGGIEIIDRAISISAEERTLSHAKADTAVAEFMRAGVDAILAYSDTTAARLIQVLSERGVRIPDDIAICGLSNLEIGGLISPRLTTIDERPDDVAEAMLNLMLAQLKDRDTPTRQIIIKPKLIIRDST